MESLGAEHAPGGARQQENIASARSERGPKFACPWLEPWPRRSQREYGCAAAIIATVRHAGHCDSPGEKPRGARAPPALKMTAQAQLGS